MEPVSKTCYISKATSYTNVTGDALANGMLKYSEWRSLFNSTDILCGGYVGYTVIIVYT